MSHRQIDPRKVLTVEAKRLLCLYRKANKDRPGPEPTFDNFLLEAGKDLGIDASSFMVRDNGEWTTRYEAWKRGAGYRRMQYEMKLHGKYLESNWSKKPRPVPLPNGMIMLQPGRISSFMKAVAAVMAALENGPGGQPPKPMPSDRELMRIFRPPGKKNCSAEDLARFRPAIKDLAKELTKCNPIR